MGKDTEFPSNMPGCVRWTGNGVSAICRRCTLDASQRCPMALAPRRIWRIQAFRSLVRQRGLEPDVCPSSCCGNSEKNGGQETQTLGHSRGGFSARIHVSIGAQGKPLRLIADRSCAAQDFVDETVEGGAQAVIPPHPGTLVQRAYDIWLYRERHLVECLINKVKHFQRVFSRFDKLATHYLGYLQFVGALMWLR